SPGETLGGGSVVDPHPKGRHKRFNSGLLARLETLSQGLPVDILFQAALALHTAPIKEIVARSNLEANQASQALRELVDNRKLLLLDEPSTGIDTDSTALVIPHTAWDEIVRRALSEVERFHRENPLRKGIPREELKSRLNLSSRPFNAILERIVSKGILEEARPLVFKPGHRIQFSQSQELAISKMMSIYEKAPFTPPSIKETKIVLGEEVYNALVDLGLLIAVSEEIAFRKEDYQHLIAEVRGLLQKNGEITAAQVRDHFNTSRRYALALLEHMDAKGITLREGDVRKLRS
ncbi:MAG: SelB C-terminal domain-containing protein, partial [Anaerolineales bacterium]